MIEFFQGTDNQSYFRVKAHNGEKLCHSEGYSSRQMAEKGAQALIRLIKAL